MSPPSLWQRYHKSRKLQANILDEHRYKNFEQNPAIHIQQYIKEITQHDKVEFTPGMQGFFSIHKSINVIYHVNNLKNKNHMIISIYAEKNSWQNSAPMYDKISPESGHRGNMSQHNKVIYYKPTASIILNGEKLKAISLRSGTR